MRVLLVFFNHPPTPFNSSVAALAGAVRDAGHEATALSLPLTATVVDAARQVDDRNADIVAVTAMTRDWPAARALFETMKPGPFRVAGGYHPSLAPHDVSACDAVDAICIADGERPLVALLEQLGSNRTPETGPGLWVRTASGFVGDPPRADPEPNMGALPLWDYDVFGDVSAMLDRGINTFGPLSDRFLPTRASRGCPYRCAYCSAPRWGNVAGFGAANSASNLRPVTALCDELADLRDRHEPDGFEFWDEHFPVDMDWLEEFADVYPRRVGIPFKVEMHPNAASRQRLELLVKAGCVLFHCGVESGDERLRIDTLNRRSPDSVLVDLFDNARELGLETSASVMTALPGETYAQAHSTVELLERLRPDSFMWSTFSPLPFTPLGDRAVQQWPGPSRQRLDDYRRAQTKLPSAMSDAERANIHRELAELQTRLVNRAAETGGDARPRPIAIPTDEQPVSITPARTITPLEAKHAARIAMLLGWAPPGVLASDVPRLDEATHAHRELLLTVDAGQHGAHVITIGRRGDKPAYVETTHLGIAYRGKDAPEPVRAILDRLAVRLASTTFDVFIPED